MYHAHAMYLYAHAQVGMAVAPMQGQQPQMAMAVPMQGQQPQMAMAVPMSTGQINVAVPLTGKFDPQTGAPLPKFDPQTGRQNW